MGKKKDLDRGEKVSLMEPIILSSSYENRTRLNELSFELASKSSALKASLPESTLQSLAGLVRVMNCYYSNLIEGHNTHPIEIEKALKADYSKDKKKRNLQLEAEAHVTVQKWIDEGGLSKPATSVDSILEIHKRFCEKLPKELLKLEDPKKKGKFVDVIPGEFRTRTVQVGEHVAISAGAVPRFLEKYSKKFDTMGKAETVLNAAAAHHRLLWIHPFLDGNGRVARLVSYAQLLHSLESAGIWSIARGLARNVDQYKEHLMACDGPRWNDFDGRGTLSERALGNFTEFFLQTCLDQVTFMSTLIEPNLFRSRVLSWAELEVKAGNISSSAPKILEAVLYKGELQRSELPDLLDVKDRQARRISKGLLDAGALKSESDRAPLKMALPAHLATHFMPGLFPPG